LYGTVTGTNANGWTSGQFGNAISLNGADGYVLTPPMATPPEFTVACWAKSKVATWNENVCFFAKRPSFFLTGVLGTTSIRFSVYIGGSEANQRIVWTAPAGFDITQWHHYAGVAIPSSGAMYLYVDGVLVASRSFTPGTIDPDDAGAFFIGKDDYPGRFLNGYMDDVRIYNYAMTDIEIPQLMAIEASKIVHLKLNDGEGAASAVNSTANGPNGVLCNVSSADWTTSGKIDGALHLNGTSNMICPGMNTPQEFTLSCWAKSDSATWNDWGCFFAKRPSFFLTPYLGSTGIRFDIFYGGGINPRIIWTAPAGFDITQWHHYVGIGAPLSGKMYLYVDGVLVSTTAFTPGTIDPDNNGDLFIGKDDYSGRYLKGTMDDARVYSRSLNANEIIELFQETNPPPY